MSIYSNEEIRQAFQNLEEKIYEKILKDYNLDNKVTSEQLRKIFQQSLCKTAGLKDHVEVEKIVNKIIDDVLNYNNGE